jgi:hypothetical protein
VVCFMDALFSTYVGIGETSDEAFAAWEREMDYRDDKDPASYPMKVS